MAYHFWLFREEGYSTLVIEEYGYFFKYLIIEGQVFFSDTIECPNLRDSIPRSEWSEIEESCLIRTIRADQENRYNYAFEIGLKAS